MNVLFTIAMSGTKRSGRIVPHGRNLQALQSSGTGQALLSSVSQGTRTVYIYITFHVLFLWSMRLIFIPYSLVGPHHVE